MKSSHIKAALSIALALSLGTIATTSHAKLVVNETTQEVQAYDYFKKNLLYKYQVKTNDQIILPLDIADLPLVKGSIIKDQNKLPNLFSSNNKVLSDYLSQNKQAGDLFVKLQKRLAATTQGKVSKSMTLSQALNEEALFKFLEIKVTPQTVTPEILDYLKARGLDQKELSALSKWSHRNVKSPEYVETIAGAIATELNNSYNRR